MATFTSEQIRGLALDGAGLHFLKSEEVAQRIRRTALAHLRRNGIRVEEHGEHLVTVRPDPRWTGTWSVSVFLPGVVLHTDPGREVASQERQIANAVLRAALWPGDLVTTWRSR